MLLPYRVLTRGSSSVARKVAHKARPANGFGAAVRGYSTHPNEWSTAFFQLL